MYTATNLRTLLRATCCGLLFFGAALSAASVRAGGLWAPVGGRYQAGPVTGQVTDPEGQPLPGVNVVEKGTSNGTQTGADGRYSFAVPEQATLVFSYVGYTAQETAVAGKTTINISLVPSAKELGDVVVVGYGTQKKVNLTGAVGVIKGETIAERTFPNSSKALQGLSPGLTVIDRGGAPGQDGAAINIRGVGTLGNANPLILVDNVPVNSIDDVRPTDIASISILKDAASASIYGSRAANGVVLITTKRGKDGKITVNYNAYVASQTTTRLPEGVGIKDYMDIINESFVNAGLQPKYSPDYIARTLSGEDPVKYPNTNWQKEIFQPNVQTNHALSISGGTQKSTTFLSLNYLDQGGIVKNINAQNYNIRLNNDFHLSDRITAGVDAAFTRKQNTQPYNTNDIFWSLYSDLAPTVAPVYPDGTYGIGTGNRSPLGALNASGFQNFTSDNIFLNLKSSYKIIDGLNLNANYSANLYKNNSQNRRFDYVFRDYYSKAELYRYNSYLYLQQGNASETNARVTLDYKKTIGVHEFSALAGAEQILHKDDQINASRSLFYSNDLQELPLGDPTTRDNSSGSSSWALQSLYGRINYALFSKYLFEVNLRYDGSSRFSTGQRYGLFPSFSAGWRISEENFTKSLGFISDLKLRASWGRLGNQDIGLYQYLPTVALQQNYAFGNALANGAAVNNLANQFIKWETSTSTNVGLDASFFQGKLAFTVDVFDKQTKDILLTLDIPYTIGLAPPTQNAGAVQNRGVEVSVSHNNQIGKFKYSLGLNFADIKNKVISLAGTGPYVTETSIIKEGESINAIFGYEAAGLFRTQQELNDYPKFNGFTTLGSVRYKDQNNDGKINNDDKIVIGPTIPQYTFGTNLNLDYSGVFLNIFLQGAANVYTMPRGGIFDGPYWGSFVTKDWLDRWTPNNPNGSFPSIAYQRSSPSLQPSTFSAQDASYVRLKNVQLGYNLPTGLTSKVKIANVRFYVSGTNLLTFTKAKYVDPELASGRFDAYPQTRIFSLGTNITF